MSRNRTPTPAERTRAETRPGGRPADRPQVLVATRSPHKLSEIRELLSEAPVDFVSLRELGIEAKPEEEDLERFASFVENARAKARYFRLRTSMPTVADDSGLVVDALGGAPGVRSKRFAPEDSVALLGRDEANNQHLLQKLEDVAEERRTAHYHCAMVAVDAGGEFVVEGTVYGRLAGEPRGSGGFGYDPLFILPAYGRTYGELPDGVKRATSHRSRAARALLPWLEGLASEAS